VTSLIKSFCVIEERNGQLGVVANFNKRYITLATVAGVIGLGLNLANPQGLLKGKGVKGFTVALLEYATVRLFHCLLCNTQLFAAIGLLLTKNGVCLCFRCNHPGLMMGKRHMPLNAAFMNGMVEGDNVWIPMSNFWVDKTVVDLDGTCL
jgi:acyl-CoA dehydrogenase